MAVTFEPPPPSNMTTSDGKVSVAADAWFRRIGNSIASVVSGLSNVQGQTEGGSFSIAFPSNRSYPVKLNSSFAFTIQSITSKCSSGSCTATFNINGTNLTGTANAVSTTEQTQSYTGNNVVNAGDDVNCVISANSACQFAIFEIAYTRN